MKHFALYSGLIGSLTVAVALTGTPSPIQGQLLPLQNEQQRDVSNEEQDQKDEGEGQSPQVRLCKEEVHRAFAMEQRTYRAHLFGHIGPSDAPLGSVRFAKNGTAYVKMEDDVWQFSLEEEPISTEDMVGLAEQQPRQGIFQTKGLLSSELIPYAAQSMRAFDCNIAHICEAILASLRQQEKYVQQIDTTVAGCLPKKHESLPACHFAALDTNVSDEAIMRTYCPEVAAELLHRETELLKTAVEYDAAYRSALQFSGISDALLTQTAWPFAFTLQQAHSLLQEFSRLPCFSSSCTDAPL